MKDREAIARAYCKWSNVDPDMVFAVNEDMTEAAIPAWQQRTALGMADAIINGLADAGLTIASVASLTRAEEEREEFRSCLAKQCGETLAAYERCAQIAEAHGFDRDFLHAEPGKYVLVNNDPGNVMTQKIAAAIRQHGYGLSRADGEKK